MWELICTWIQWLGLPLVAIYHLLCSNVLINVSAVEAEGIEKMANFCLVPVQYLLAGMEAEPCYAETGEYIGYAFHQRFSYQDEYLLEKTIGASLMAVPSIVFGSLLKGVALLSSEVQKRHEQMKTSRWLAPQRHLYASMGISVADSAEWITSDGYLRRPEDCTRLQEERKALQEIVTLLEAHDILYWLDCGTCLGALRHEGLIPWDWDIDIAILQPDFDNVKTVLSYLDPHKYQIQDWSSRDKPKTYLKVYVKASHSLIDIYHFAIDAERKEIHSILSNENSIFLPESWKIRERRYTIPTPFSYVFPLKRARFDGITAFVPCQTEAYLKQRYKDISPARVYDETTGQYEKVKGHSYWQDVYAR